MSVRGIIRVIGTAIIAAVVAFAPYTSRALVGLIESALRYIGIRDWTMAGYQIALFIVLCLILYLVSYLIYKRSKES